MIRPARMEEKALGNVSRVTKKKEGKMTYVLKSTKKAIQHPPKSQEA
jgi:hypothetical protein